MSDKLIWLLNTMDLVLGPWKQNCSENENLV